MAVITPYRLDVTPFREEKLHELGFERNWPELRRILGRLTDPTFAVVDAYSQLMVDDARRRFDSCVDGVEKRNALMFTCVKVNAVNGLDGAGAMLELLLSIGLDADVCGGDGWRPSHTCAHVGRFRATRAILLCRPDMKAQNPNGDTPLGAALVLHYKGDDEFPERSSWRQDVAAFIQKGNFETKHKTLAELAVRKFWFAVKNLVRRQVVPASEYEGTVSGKTAAEWAEHFGEKRIAEELRYYASLPSAKLLDAEKKIKDLKGKVDAVKSAKLLDAAKIKGLEDEVKALKSAKLSDAAMIKYMTGKLKILECGRADEKDRTAALKRTALMQRLAAVIKVKRDAEEAEAELRKEVRIWKDLSAAHEKKVDELSETVAVLTSRLPEEVSGHAVDESARKKPKMDGNDGVSMEEEQTSLQK